MLLRLPKALTMLLSKPEAPVGAKPGVPLTKRIAHHQALESRRFAAINGQIRGNA
jgi:hypothetical protein